MTNNKDEPAPRDDGTTRKAHYGSGRQPWDDIVDMGWGPHFAAGNVLKYLRRTKDPEHSLASARWYFARLKELEKIEEFTTPAVICVIRLKQILTKDEWDRVRNK